MTNQAWSNLPFCPEAYEVSNSGKIRRKYTNGNAMVAGNEIALRTNGIYPHLFFEVSKMEDSKRIRKTIYIHKIVAELFLPRPTPQHVYVKHLDGDYNNNDVSNLKWITAYEHAKSVVNAEKSWITRRIRYGKSGGSYGRPRKNK